MPRKARIFTVKDIAREWGVTERAIYKRIESKKLKATKLGGEKEKMFIITEHQKNTYLKKYGKDKDPRGRPLKEEQS